MKIAIVYNRESRNVINLFGVANREKYGLKSIQRIVDALKKGGHQVVALEGDKDLIDRLEEFMPRVMKGERPGMAFNLSYGIQGQARYTHVPGMLEMAGIPYVGSGPLAHSLALDKVVAKMIFRQHGLPTPNFAVLSEVDAPVPELPFPLIVKPRNEAVSFGIKIVQDETELREAAGRIFDEFDQPVLVEQFIEGREVNVGLLGNNPPDALPPVELVFGEGGPAIYTYEDKTRQSGREIQLVCPAPIGKEPTQRAQEIARRAFTALGCYDCARVDMRLDAEGQLWILEVNSLPSLGEHGSYVDGAAHVGLDFAALVNRLVEVASARYFGTPNPPTFEPRVRDPGSLALQYLTTRRDRIERRVREWCSMASRTGDPIGNQAAVRELDRTLRDLRLHPVDEFTVGRASWCWETEKGLDGGTLLVAHVDVPLGAEVAHQPFRLGPEWIHGEGVGASRGPLVSMEFALRALRSQRRLRRLPLGVLVYADEGRDCADSAAAIRAAAARVQRVLVLRPANRGDKLVTQRRGQRKYRVVVEGKAMRPGHSDRRSGALRWVCEKVGELAELSSRKDRVSVAAVDIKTDAFPLLLPHRVTVTLLVTYLETVHADATEKAIRACLRGDGFRARVDLVSDRPPLREQRRNLPLLREIEAMAKRWEIPIGSESSVWPSVAGLVPAPTPVICGVGPVATDLYTPREAVQRISLMQRTLLLAELLASGLASHDRSKSTPAAQA